MQTALESKMSTLSRTWATTILAAEEPKVSIAIRCDLYTLTRRQLMQILVAVHRLWPVGDSATQRQPQG